MDEGLLQLIIDCSGVIGGLLVDPLFVVLAIVSGLAWMFGGQGQHQNPQPWRIALRAVGVVAPLAIYLGVRFWRGDVPAGFEAIAAFVFSMIVGAVVVMFAVFGVLLAVAFAMTVIGGRKS